MVLEAIRYKKGSLQILNQLKLPHAEEYDTINNTKDAWQAIKEMRTRGAPAIAIVAALSLAVEISLAPIPSTATAVQVAQVIHDRLDYLVTSRPTAVNLADAVRKLKAVVDDELANVSANGDDDGAMIKHAYIEAAEQMLADDVSDNENIGKYGADWILKTTAYGDGTTASSLSVITHCNTGSLATAGYGTALGVIRSLQELGVLKRAFCTETRPYNQGSRLTAFELVHDKIPATLITDSMAAALLRLKGASERIAAIVVGADRVAANGDTANKIGTYSLAILARFHGVKFLVAAPRTTIDLSTTSGADIVIEERPPKEVTLIKGPKYDAASNSVLLGSSETISTAASGIDVWNPAFDVTPAELIDGIITEVGVVEKDQKGAFPLRHLFRASTNGSS